MSSKELPATRLSRLHIQTSRTNAFNACFLALFLTPLRAKAKATHTGLDTENVVVDREHVHGGGSNRRWDADRDLRVVDAGEVASTSWLVLFWLEGEGVRVHTRVWVTTVVVV